MTKPDKSNKRKSPLDVQAQNHKRVLRVPAPRKKQKTDQSIEVDEQPIQSLVPTLPSTEPQASLLQFEGCRDFRDRLVYSTLSGKPIRIDSIRSLDENPGLTDYEVSFLRLLELISNGAKVHINETGTSVKYHPGLLRGGDVLGLTHDCPVSRSVGYFIEPLCLLAPFVKNPLVIKLTGVTNGAHDLSVDLLRTVTLPLMKTFHPDLVPSLTVKKRGCLPLGGGEVEFSCPIVKSLQPVTMIDEGKIKRVRGLALATRVSAQIANQMIESAKGVLLKLLPDVHIYADHYKGRDSGLSPGFALSLVAESTTGSRICTEAIGKHDEVMDPVALGKQVATKLLTEISKGGYIDSLHQSMALSFAALGPEAVSRIRLGKLTSHTVQCLRLLQQFFGVTFQLTAEESPQTILCSNMGAAFININRKTD